MCKSKKVFKEGLNKLKVLPLVAAFFIPLAGAAQNTGDDTEQNSERVELKYKQRHSSKHISKDKELYADGIKIKRDLSILKEAQEQRILSENEIPADELYGGIWDNRYISAYRSLENTPEEFTVSLENFTMPTPGHITSRFGPRRWGRRTKMHYGIDLKLQVGDTVYAAFDGKIRVKQYERRGYGYYLAIRHTNGLETVYGHLSKFLVEEDQVVKSGDPIALGGNTGRSTGAHLHFETRFLGNYINPEFIIDFTNKVCHADTYKVNSSSYIKSGGVNVKTLAASSATRSSKTVKNKYASGNASYHRIKKGDTLGTIARKYGTSIKKICSMNSITTKTVLRPGRSLKVS